MFKRANGLVFTRKGLEHVDGYIIASWDEITKIQSNLKFYDEIPQNILSLAKNKKKIDAVKLLREKYPNLSLKDGVAIYAIIEAHVEKDEEVLTMSEVFQKAMVTL